MSYTPHQLLPLGHSPHSSCARWELAAGVYRLQSFLLSKMLTSAPLEAVQVLFVGSIFYFIVGLQASAVKFWQAMLVMVLCGINSSTVGHLVAVLTPNLSYAFPLLTVVCTMCMSFCGYIGESSYLMFAVMMFQFQQSGGLGEGHTYSMGCRFYHAITQM